MQPYVLVIFCYGSPNVQILLLVLVRGFFVKLLSLCLIYVVRLSVSLFRITVYSTCKIISLLITHMNKNLKISVEVVFHVLVPYWLIWLPAVRLKRFKSIGRKICAPRCWGQMNSVTKGANVRLNISLE